MLSCHGQAAERAAALPSFGVASAVIHGTPTSTGTSSFTLRVDRFSGALPPGLSLQRSPGRVTGRPTTAGTFTFRVRATDQRGRFAERTFSIAISRLDAEERAPLPSDGSGLATTLVAGLLR